jgi:hypothetical protein
MMKKTCSKRSYGKRKAPAGAFSDRYGPRLVRHKGPVASSSPWIEQYPVFGVTVVLLPNGTATIRQ